MSDETPAKKHVVQLRRAGLGRKVAEEKKKSAKEEPVVQDVGGVPGPMTLSQISQVPPDRRRQPNAQVPEELKLHRRLALYYEDHGSSATKQNVVAWAVDRLLREEGY